MTKRRPEQRSVATAVTRAIPTVRSGTTAAAALAALQRRGRTFASVDYLYLVDRARRLRGVCTISDVLCAAPNTPMTSLARTRGLVSIPPAMTQEQAALLAVEKNVKALPVVDADGIFLGVFANDAVLTTLHREAREDALRLAGIHPRALLVDNVLTIPLRRALEHRLPWLLLGLLGGVIAARVIRSFERTLAENLVLAAFIPLIVYMSDAVGTQMEAFVVRDLSLRARLQFGRYFLRQLTIVCVTALAFSALLFLAVLLLYADGTLALALALALAFAVLSSVCTGLLIPYGFSKLQLDPANASGPIATILQDLLSVVIYFAIAEALL